MDRDHTQGFNERLSQWIASQGFWFQLRYSTTGTGGISSFAYHLVRLLVRVCMFMVLVALGCTYYLNKRTSSPSFIRQLVSRVEKEMDASNVVFQSYVHKGGELRIKSLQGQGTNAAFFDHFEATDVACEMSALSPLRWLDSATGGWNAGVVSMRTLNLGLKPGYDSAEAAARGAACLFRDYEGFKFNRLEVADATLNWGYSDEAKSAIEHTALTATREGRAWKVRLKGGYLRHGWLERLDIVELSATVTDSGIRFDKADFKLQDAPVQCENLQLVAGERPQVSGVLQFKHAPLSALVVKQARGMMDGYISGRLEIQGSTNDMNGLAFVGKLELKEKDVISLREDIALLHALAVLDAEHEFHRVPMTSGSMGFQSYGTQVKLSNILLVGETLQVKGELLARHPNREEITRWLSFDSKSAADEALRQLRLTAGSSREDRPAEVVTEGADDGGDAVYRKVVAELERKYAQSQFCEGKLQLSLPASVFQKVPVLNRRFPVDSTGRAIMTLHLGGELSVLTNGQAELLLEESRRND